MKKKKTQPIPPTECVCECCGIKRHDLGWGREGQTKHSFCPVCRKITTYTVIDS